MTQAICGCALGENEKPFTFKKIKEEVIIELHGKEFGSAWGKIADDEIINNIVSALNNAYKRGFSACGEILMPQLMKIQKEVGEKDGIK
jgi:hypothetical protein